MTRSPRRRSASLLAGLIALLVVDDHRVQRPAELVQRRLRRGLGRAERRQQERQRRGRRRLGPRTPPRATCGRCSWRSAATR